MKKTIILATILGALVSSPAFARTEGNQVGLSLLKTDTSRLVENSQSDNIGVGIDYKYAFNFDRVFVAPGIFYDYNRVDASTYNAGSTTNTTQLKIHDSYGVKVNIGYDINDKWAAFVIGGLSNSDVSGGQNHNKNLNTGTKAERGLVYGVGAKYAINDMFDLNLGLERTNYDSGSGAATVVNNSYSVVRVGTILKF
jgi:hypothetical protein